MYYCTSRIISASLSRCPPQTARVWSGLRRTPEVIQRDLGIVTRDLGIVTRDLGIVTSDLGIVTRDLGIVTRDLGIVTSDLGIVTRDLGIVTRDLGIVTSDLGIVTSDLGIVTRDLGIVTRVLGIVKRDYVESKVSFRWTVIPISPTESLNTLSWGCKIRCDLLHDNQIEECENHFKRMLPHIFKDKSEHYSHDFVE